MPSSDIMILSGLTLALVGLWVTNRLQPDADIAVIIKSSMEAEFSAVLTCPSLWPLLVAFVWSLYEVLSRMKSGDLTPIELEDVVIRFVTAVPIGFAFSLLVFDKVSPWLAFVASAFPLRDLRQLIRKQALRKIGETPASSSSLTKQSYIGQVLSDIGKETIVRLEELNIVTCMDLAYANPVKLMIKQLQPRFNSCSLGSTRRCWRFTPRPTFGSLSDWECLVHWMSAISTRHTVGIS